ncbi:Nucleotidyltransferase [Exidia glandulosa HHB12029]|uniref:DNA-directed DNA polymerase n=1 Tax=Exidia glandulosa HHB12029 TaxID=1314781 RepID=A0A165MRI2_EXIGL|nr:Nucleotidyltransferase [Exidia glandulosa HHB12029]
MSQRRPAATTHTSSSSSRSAFSPVRQGPLSGISVYIIQPKLSASEIGQLFGLAEQLGATISSDIAKADVIVTAIAMRARLERHLSWAVAQTKDVVTPAWLHDCAKQRVRLSAQLYPAIHIGTRPLSTSASPAPSRKRKASSSPAKSPGADAKLKSARTATPPPESALPTPALRPALPPPSLLERFPPTSRFSVQRLHPLVCPNQALIKELAIIRRARELEGEDRSALSYMRAISAIKAHPTELKSSKEAKTIPFVGSKILGMVGEFLKHGAVSEASELRVSERYKGLCELTTIHGIGPTRAREFYARGLTSLDELDRYYGVVVPDGYGNWIRNEDVEALAEDEDGVESIIREALALREDLTQTIPRAEVERIARAVADELEAIEPGCLHTICGGYRRGKPASNDVDIVFTHPEARRIRGLCTRLVDRLKSAGIVSRSWSHNQTYRKLGEGPRVHDPGLDKSLVVLRLAPDPCARRVDLIFAPPESYWAAVVGWTGSIMFERDLRLWAKEKNLKFNDSGLTRRVDTKLIPANDEREVFQLCGLEYIEPEWRNADL